MGWGGGGVVWGLKTHQVKISLLQQHRRSTEETTTVVKKDVHLTNIWHKACVRYGKLCTNNQNLHCTIYDRYGLLTKCKVKITGYIGQTFLRVYGPTQSVQSHIINPLLTKQACSVKSLLYGFGGNISCGTWRAVPRGEDIFILPARVANHSAVFDSSCLLEELVI